MSNEQYFADTLGLQPHGGGIGTNFLETKLASLGDQKNLQLYIMNNLNDLKTALDNGPVGTFLSSHSLNDVPWEHKLTHAVTLDRIKQDPITQQWQVVILDELISEPYQVSIDKFARFWNKRTILPKDTIVTIENSRPPRR